MEGDAGVPVPVRYLHEFHREVMTLVNEETGYGVTVAARQQSHDVRIVRTCTTPLGGTYTPRSQNRSKQDVENIEKALENLNPKMAQSVKKYFPQ